jgi:hypothetical protein
MLLDKRPAPEVRPAEPTPTLRLLAGDYAARVAALWPAPHGAYLEMPAQRRHLVHIVLDFAPKDETMADALRFARADALARDRLGELPPGFVRLLGRLGELAWNGADYFALISLYEDEASAAVLRQSCVLTAPRVHAMAALAPPLRVLAIARHLDDPALAALVDEAWRAIVAARGADAGGAAARRWTRANNPARLYEMAAEDMAPAAFELAPFPHHPDLRRLGGVHALEDAGRRFRNCLLTYKERAADGSIALYEWAGPPPAAVSLARDGVFGWRLEEARGVANAVLDAAARSALTAHLVDAGVRVGRSGREIEARLLRAAGKPHPWIDESEQDAFGLTF